MPKARTRPLPDVGRLVEEFNYGPATGRIYYRANGLVADKEGSRGYRFVRFAGENILSHRLAWAILYGRWPAEIDHANGDPGDNRLVNLRECSRSENQMNRRGWGSCPKGVYKQGTKFRAQIRAAGQTFRLGYHDTPEEAHQAYLAAVPKYHGQFARSS